MTIRLTHCLDRALIPLPEDGLLVAIGPEAPPPLPQDRTLILHPDICQVTALQAQGWTCDVHWPDAPHAAIVTVPRARARAQGWIAAAAQAVGPKGLVVVDGAKTDGIDPLLKAIKARQPLLGQEAKAHGRCFWFQPNADFSDWVAHPTDVAGYVTRPGVFSADGPDPASRALAAALPADLRGAVGDLGAGWGFLSRAIAAHPDVTTLHLIEADHDALSCAKSNVTDPRARFHWADATRWDTPELLDTVVMNPPFHIGRKADPALGQAFITAAARNLKPRGRLLMVANRHLPYEADIETCFATQRLVSDANGFKIIEALSPRLRGPRTGARSQAARPTTRHRLS